MKTFPLANSWLLAGCLFLAASVRAKPDMYLDNDAYRAIAFITLGGKGAGVFYLEKLDNTKEVLRLEETLPRGAPYENFLNLLKENEKKDQPRYGLVEYINETGNRRLVFISFIPKSASEEDATLYEKVKGEALRFTPAGFKIDASSTSEIPEDVVKKVVNGPVIRLPAVKRVISELWTYIHVE